MKKIWLLKKKKSLWKKFRERRERERRWGMEEFGGWDVNKKEVRRGLFFVLGLLFLFKIIFIVFS